MDPYAKGTGRRVGSWHAGATHIHTIGMRTYACDHPHEHGTSLGMSLGRIGRNMLHYAHPCFFAAYLGARTCMGEDHVQQHGRCHRKDQTMACLCGACVSALMARALTELRAVPVRLLGVGQGER